MSDTGKYVVDFIRWSSSTGERVLYVDDDALMRRAFARSVSFEGQGVDTAGDSSEAVSLSRAHQYPVIVTDLMLPGTNGFALIEELRQLQPDASFVMVTGTETDLSAHHAADESISFFVKKPWDDDELTSTLTSAYRLHRKRISMRCLPSDNEIRVLLIEDDAMDAMIVARILAGSHLSSYKVTQTERLQDAVTLLARENFEVVLTDLSLPDARGLDAVSRIRAAAPHAALVVLSGIDDEALSMQAVELGAQDYLVKGSLEQTTLARRVGYAIERKRHEEQLEYMAQRDSLTNLANRATFTEKLNKAVARCRRRAAECGVMFLDLDGFKRINDTHGHAAGDVVLREVSRRLLASVREEDTVARPGGDEFAILIEDMVDDDNCSAITGRILDIINMPILLREGLEVIIHASIGVAVYPRAARSAETLLQAADRAMYEAKARGGGVAVAKRRPRRDTDPSHQTSS